MTHKERIMAAINHEEPDTVPIDSWLAPEVATVLVNLLNIDPSVDTFGLPRTLGNDLLYGCLGICEGYNSMNREERRIGDNLFQDAWGIKWTRKEQEYGAYCEFAEHPLADIKAYDNYKFPDPLENEKEGYELYEALMAPYGSEYAILGGVPCSIFEGAWYLRGLENFMIDLRENREFADELMQKCMEYHLVVSEKLVEMGVDIIWWGDDVSCESGPMVNPEVFTKLIKPKMAGMVEAVKKINKDVKIAFHSDGKIDWLLDHFVEIGIDIINPLQPDANDIPAFKKRYGDKLTVWGNVDTRTVMSRGSCADVVQEVKRVIEVLGPGGGLILCSNHTIQSTPRAVDNTIAFYWAAQNFRHYPIQVSAPTSDAKVDFVF